MELLVFLGLMIGLGLAANLFGADSRRFDRPNW
ncbi:hypothetical protein BH23CHL3_BH23CHL3_08680 [soil metagenome]|jgi:hypothetical protein